MDRSVPKNGVSHSPEHFQPERRSMAKEEYRQAQRIKPLGTDGLEKIRKIVAEKQYRKVNEVMVDLFSASAVLAVYDKLSPENQEKLRGLPVGRVVTICFKLIK